MIAPLAALFGARVRRVDVPEPDLVALGLDRDRVLVLSTDPQAPEIGAVRARPRGRPAEGIAKQLRNLLEGARIESALDAGGGAIAIDLRRGDDPLALVHEALGDRSNVLVLDREGRTIAALHPRRLTDRGLALGRDWSPPAHERIREVPGDLDALIAAGEALLERRRESHDRAIRQGLERGIRRARRRLERRAAATLADLDRAADVDGLRARASAILAALHTIPRGATEIDLPDPTAHPPATLRVQIDPERGARASADALFARARKIEAGAAIAAARHAEAKSLLAALDALAERAIAADDLEGIEAEAVRLGVTIDPSPDGRRRGPAARSPFRHYTGHGGRAILVGRGANDNDALTFEHARPHDLWVHVRGASGSHVIVPLARHESCPAELLIDAAHLAAHFSSTRGETQVEIQTAPRKQLRRPRGGAPGQVLVTQEKVFLLRVEPSRLAGLLATTPPDLPGKG